MKYRLLVASIGLGLTVLLTGCQKSDNSAQTSSSSSDTVAAQKIIPTSKNYIATNKDLHINNVSITTTAPEATSTVAYMTIKNQGKNDISLVGVTSPIAQKAEIDAIVMSKGAMKMRHIDSLGINPGSTVELKPNGFHVTLMGLKKPITSGMQVPLELAFSDGSKASLKAVGMGKTAKNITNTSDNTNTHNAKH